MAYLILSDREHEFDRRELGAEPVVIGRAVDVDIPIRDILLSRRHCRIEPLAGGDRWVVTDLGSKNGTRVGADLLTEPRVLRDGEVIRAGKIRICFRAGRYEPPPPEVQQRKQAVRPADPIEALSGTVMGFQITDMEENSQRSGFPIPKPRPAEPAEPAPRERERVQAMVRQQVQTQARSVERSRAVSAAATANTGIPTAVATTTTTTTPRKPIVRAGASTAGAALAPVRRPAFRGVQPVRRQVPRPVVRNPDPNTRARVPGWLAVTYIACAALVFLCSLVILLARSRF
jgi:pSer/pThr/pTyr-binding forkhead associated (FHA) protein